jgi:alanyl-tRNA synthetase
MKTREVIEGFLDYYEGLGAKILPGSSLLDPAVPQSFVMSAGLSQFESTPPEKLPQEDRQYALCQNCFRHFDIERVPQSKIHLSQFQMLGAFHFGSVERTLAIERLWHLLLDIYKVDLSRLWVTYFAGGQINGCWVKADEKTRETWLNLGLPADRVVGLGKDNNFWRQGPSTVGVEASHKGGPYTEVYFDRGEDKSCGCDCRPGCPCGRFVEFSSVLFISHWIGDESGILGSLDLPFTETVAGVERSAMLIQGANSIFEVDSLRPLVTHVHSFPRKPKTRSPIESAISEWIIADHVRAVLFLASDGAPAPGKGGRRRLMRILVRQSLTHMQLLGVCCSDLLSSLIDTMLELYGESLSDSFQCGRRVLDYFGTEALRFERTIESGKRHIESILSEEDVNRFTGSQILDLVKRRGIPLPLVKLALAQKDVSFDEQEYWQAYEAWYQSQISKSRPE